MKLRKFITRRRPKRATIRRGLISLVLGIVLTVAIAWWFAMYGSWSPGVVRSDSGILEGYRPESWPAFDIVYDCNSIGFHERTAFATVYVGEDPLPREPDFSSDGAVWMIEQQSGFPWACMRSLQSEVSPPREWESAFEEMKRDRPVFPLLDRGLAQRGWPDNEHSGRVLPLRPMWPGALYSVLFYSVLVLPMVCLVEFGWRHRHFRVDYRRRHDQCLKCKYPVGAFAICPECGTAVESDK